VPSDRDLCRVGHRPAPVSLARQAAGRASGCRAACAQERPWPRMPQRRFSLRGAACAVVPPSELAAGRSATRCTPLADPRSWPVRRPARVIEGAAATSRAAMGLLPGDACQPRAGRRLLSTRCRSPPPAGVANRLLLTRRGQASGLGTRSTRAPAGRDGAAVEAELLMLWRDSILPLEAGEILSL
jgi:hypothetical protein